MMVCLVSVGVAADEVVVALQDVSVTIQTPDGQGSGVIITRNGIHYVLSAAHVVESCRKAGTLDNEAKTDSFVYFDGISVVKEYQEKGRLVARNEYFADVVKYSDVDFGEDLVILKLRKTNCLNVSTVFYLDEAIPAIGTELYHVGSFYGQPGANSLSTGVISQIGRIPAKLHTYFDQTSVTAFPGSSGGGVFLKKDGRYISMLVRGSGETMNLTVPIRRIKAWVKKINMEWLLNPDLPAPKE
jgi:hypothetical protein